VWFGTFVTMMMVLAGISPPVGLNVFVVRSVCTDIPVTTIYKGAFPFIFIMCVSIFAICVWPDLVLGPVRSMMGQ
jgi:TRAP-type C4-dicarboxylate transport system permease large subunit